MKPAAPTIDVLVDAPAWTRALPAARALCRKAARAAFQQAAPPAAKRRAAAVELSVLLTSDAAIRNLNATYRKKDKPTNVLSFPAGGADNLGKAAAAILGDVVIAYGTVSREARATRKSLKDHLSHMVVHGVLHLLGYDHETASEAETMERLETKILSRLGTPDPYGGTVPDPARRGARRRT